MSRDKIIFAQNILHLDAKCCSKVNYLVTKQQTSPSSTSDNCSDLYKDFEHANTTTQTHRNSIQTGKAGGEGIVLGGASNIRSYSLHFGISVDQVKRKNEDVVCAPAFICLCGGESCCI